MRYIVCLALGLSLATIALSKADSRPPQPRYGIGFTVWEPRNTDCVCDYDDHIMLSVLVEHTGMWIGVSRIDEFVHVPKRDGAYDWPAFDAKLGEYKRSAFFSDRTDVELAVRSTREHPITHATLVTAMSRAQRVGFSDVVLTPADHLSANPLVHDAWRCETSPGRDACP